MTSLEKKQIHERELRFRIGADGKRQMFLTNLHSGVCCHQTDVVPVPLKSSVPKWYIRALLLWLGNSEVGFFRSHLFVPANHVDLEF